MKKKEISIDTLKRECEPLYILEYYEIGSVIKNERKFNNPRLLLNFIENLEKNYCWTIYKIRG